MQLFAVIGVALVIIYLAWIKPRYLREAAPKKALLVLSIVLVLLGASEARWQYLQWQGSEAVKAVSKNPDGVLECQRLLPSLVDMDSGSLRGEVTQLAPNSAKLKYKECSAIFDWVQGGSPDELNTEQIIGLHVLTHESVHLSGELRENVTECTAVQRDPITIQSLGGSKSLSDKFQYVYLDSIYPRLNDNYKIDGCEVDPKRDTIENPQSSK